MLVLPADGAQRGVSVQNRLFQVEVGGGQGLPGPYGVTARAPTVGSGRGKTGPGGSRGWGQVLGMAPAVCLGAVTQHRSWLPRPGVHTRPGPGEGPAPPPSCRCSVPLNPAGSDPPGRPVQGEGGPLWWAARGSSGGSAAP